VRENVDVDTQVYTLFEAMKVLSPAASKDGVITPWLLMPVPANVVVDGFAVARMVAALLHKDGRGVTVGFNGFTPSTPRVRDTGQLAMVGVTTTV
jgi:hypothetical protein